MSWLNRRIIVILLRVHSNFTRNHSPRFVEARLSSAVKRGRERMAGCLRFEYYVQSGTGIHKKRKRKRKKNERKWRKYDETKPILRRVMQPGFVSRAFSFSFRNEFDGARFLFFFSSSFLQLISFFILLYCLYYYIL